MDMTPEDMMMMFGGQTYAQKVMSLFGANLIAYWPLNETSGVTALDASGNGRNGAYTGVTLANAAQPAKIGGAAPYFDGSADYCNIYSASLNTAFSGAAGTVIALAKVNAAAIWTDGAIHRVLRIASDDANGVTIRKTATNNQLECVYAAAAVIESIVFTSSTTDWFQVGLTWSFVNNRANGYLNGAAGIQSTVLGSYVGALSNTRTLIGAQITTPAQVWNGWLCQVMVLNKEASAAEMLALYNLGA